MMIIFFKFMFTNVIPQLQLYASALFQPVMVIVITLAGIMMLFAAIGVRISANLGSTIIGGIFSAIGFVVTNVFRACGWLIQSMFRMVPRIYRESRRVFEQSGLNTGLSAILAVLITMLFVAVVI